jgi:hypothetical protein
MSCPRPRDLAEELAAMTVERGCTPAEAETAAWLLAGLSFDRELPFYRMLLWHARKHGYRPGWAAIMFKSEFGRRPDFGDLEPLEPDASMRDRLEAWRRQWARELKRTKPAARQAEVTNPPFKLAEEFARRALDRATDKVALLARLA